MSALFHGFAAATFFVLGALALVRPDVILAIRKRFRPVEDAESLKRRRSAFDARAVRICGLGLLFIAAALTRTLAT